MPLQIRCTCGRSYRLPETAVGKTFRCKKCNAANKVSRPQTRETSALPQASDSDGLLNQLFDDEDEPASAVTGQRSSNAPPAPVRTTRTHHAPEHRPVHPSIAEMGPISISLLMTVAFFTIAYLYPPLAKIILQLVFVAGAVLAIGSYVVGLSLTPEWEPIYTLLAFFVPLVFLIYAVNHLDEAGGILVFIGIGIFLMVASNFAGQWMIPGAGSFPF